MRQKNTTPMIENVDALARRAVEHRCDATYKLSLDVSDAWDDAEAGARWREWDNHVWSAFCQMYGNLYDYAENHPIRVALRGTCASSQILKPGQHRVTRYFLESKYATRLELSDELGKLVDGVWKTKKSKYGGRDERVGRVTLAGILRRLGRTDVGKVVKQAQVDAAARHLVGQQNCARAAAYERVIDLVKTMNAVELLFIPRTVGDTLCVLGIYGSINREPVGDEALDLALPNLVAPTTCACPTPADCQCTGSYAVLEVN